MIRLFVCLLLFFVSKAWSQNSVIGSWKTHHPYSISSSLAMGKSEIYSASLMSVFKMDLDNFSITTYSKSNGLSDVGVSKIGFDSINNILVIAYNNSNLDIIKNGRVINLPDIKNKIIVGDKKINHIFVHNGIAYLSAGFGLLKLDLIKEEISDTYYPGNGLSTNNVLATWANEMEIFAATSQGVFQGKIEAGTNLANFADWKAFNLIDGIPNNEAAAIAQYKGEMYASIGSTIYQFDGTTWNVFFSEANWNTISLNESEGKLLICQWFYNGSNVQTARVKAFSNGNFVNYNGNSQLQRPVFSAIDKAGRVWYSDLFTGLNFTDGVGNFPYIPNGPNSESVGKMDVLNGTLYAGGAAITERWDPGYFRSGFYSAQNYNWKNYSAFSYPAIQNYLDLASVKGLPSENKVLFGAFNYGLIEFNPADETSVIRERPSTSSQKFSVTAFASDNSGNTWMTNAYSNAPLVCRKTDGSLIPISNNTMNTRLLKGIAVDDNNQIWMVNNGNGLIVYDPANTPDDLVDDRIITYTTSAGAGGLHTNAVTCIAKDLEGDMWLGTEEGITVVRCAYAVFDRQCDADRICIPRGDTSNFCNYLLEDENVKVILVDPANRKWVGTNNGLFLISADGLKTISYFNVDNSPLISNKIRSLAFEPNSGDLYIGTDKGIISYRTDATLTEAGKGEVFVYPNPVRPDYQGPIAVKGLPNNAEVKITDINGSLVYQTTANGGQAIWDGNLLSGERAATGVYLVFALDGTGKEKAITKFVLIH